MKIIYASPAIKKYISYIFFHNYIIAMNMKATDAICLEKHKNRGKLILLINFPLFY